MGRHGIPGFTEQGSPLGYLTSRYWSPSALWVMDLVVVLTGLGFVIAVFNAAIRVLFAMGREQALPGSLARLSSRQTPVVAIGGVAGVDAGAGSAADLRRRRRAYLRGTSRGRPGCRWCSSTWR